MSTIAAVAQIAQSASIVIASLFAIYGFDAWRREHVGKRRIELAEEVLALFYQARDAVVDIRNPFGVGGEGTSRKARENETARDKEALDRAYVLIERYKRHSELFAKIHAMRYRFMAQIGVEASEPFSALNALINELIASAHRMARLATVPEWTFRSQEAEEKHHTDMLEVDRIYYGGGQDDPIAPRMDGIVRGIERTCRGIIESQGTLYAIFNLRLWKRS